MLAEETGVTRRTDAGEVDPPRAGCLAYLDGRSSTEVAEIAGLSRGEFLPVLGDKCITILEGPSTLGLELAELAERLPGQPSSVYRCLKS
jgi:hypothetical protein